MPKLQHLVVALHERESLNDVMAKAARLAQASQARISVVQTCWDPASDTASHFPQEQIESIASRLKAAELNHLSAAVAHYREQLNDIHTHVIWARRHAPAVAGFARETGADLLITAQQPAGALPKLRVPEPLKLAALTHVPLLVCAPPEWGHRVDTLALMDAANPAHDALNRRIAGDAERLTTCLGGALHVATIYEIPFSALTTERERERAAFQEATERRLRSRLESLTQGLSPTDIHVMAGDLPQRTDQLAASFQTGVIALGTAARQGLERLRLGNTAETLLLQQTDRDLLLVPDT